LVAKGAKNGASKSARALQMHCLFRVLRAFAWEMLSKDVSRKGAKDAKKCNQQQTR